MQESDLFCCFFIRLLPLGCITAGLWGIDSIGSVLLFTAIGCVTAGAVQALRRPPHELPAAAVRLCGGRRTTGLMLETGHNEVGRQLSESGRRSAVQLLQVIFYSPVFSATCRYRHAHRPLCRGRWGGRPQSFPPRRAIFSLFRADKCSVRPAASAPCRPCAGLHWPQDMRHTTPSS